MPIYRAKWTAHPAVEGWCLEFSPTLTIPAQTQARMPRLTLPPPLGPQEFNVEITFTPIESWWTKVVNTVWGRP